jgi:hypothetical protein
MIHWNDGVHGQERSTRRRREERVRKLQAAERSVRLWRIWLAVQLFIVLAHGVWLALDPRWSTAVAVVVWSIAAGAAAFWTLPAQHRLVETRRCALEYVQEEYDQVFARMVAVDNGDPVARRLSGD